MCKCFWLSVTLLTTHYYYNNNYVCDCVSARVFLYGCCRLFLFCRFIICQWQIVRHTNSRQLFNQATNPPSNNHHLQTSYILHNHPVNHRFQLFHIYHIYNEALLTHHFRFIFCFALFFNFFIIFIYLFLQNFENKYDICIYKHA